MRINGEKLDEVDSFKYLGAVVTDQGSKPEVLSRIAQTTAALARLFRRHPRTPASCATVDWIQSWTRNEKIGST